MNFLRDGQYTLVNYTCNGKTTQHAYRAHRERATWRRHYLHPSHGLLTTLRILDLGGSWKCVSASWKPRRVSWWSRQKLRHRSKNPWNPSVYMVQHISPKAKRCQIAVISRQKNLDTACWHSCTHPNTNLLAGSIRDTNIMQWRRSHTRHRKGELQWRATEMLALIFLKFQWHS